MIRALNCPRPNQCWLLHPPTWWCFAESIRPIEKSFHCLPSSTGRSRQARAAVLSWEVARQISFGQPFWRSRKGRPRSWARDQVKWHRSQYLAPTARPMYCCTSSKCISPSCKRSMPASRKCREASAISSTCATLCKSFLMSHTSHSHRTQFGPGRRVISWWFSWHISPWHHPRSWASI